MIAPEERARLLAVALCGERVVQRLDAIGIRRLEDVRGRDPYDVMQEVNIEAGRAIWHPPLAIQALENLIAAATESPERG